MLVTLLAIMALSGALFCVTLLQAGFLTGVLSALQRSCVVFDLQTDKDQRPKDRNRGNDLRRACARATWAATPAGWIASRGAAGRPTRGDSSANLLLPRFIPRVARSAMGNSDWRALSPALDVRKGRIAVPLRT